MTDRMQEQARSLAAALQDLNTRVKNLAAKPGLAYSSIEGGRIEDYDSFGQLRGMIGTQPDGTHTVTTVNGPVPPRPSMPACEGGQSTLTARWDGLFLNDQDQPDEMVYVPSDFARVEVHASQDPDFSALFAETLLGTIETPRGADVTTRKFPGTWYVRLVARSQSGKASAPSPAVEVTVLDQIDTTEVTAQLDAARTEIDAAQARIDAEAIRLDETFGLAQADATSKADAAKAAAITAAAADAQLKADAALAAANAQVAQVIARGQSLVRNGDFEAGTDGWAVPSTGAAVESGTARSGVLALRIGPNLGGNTWPVSDWVPASTGRSYSLEYWAQRSGTEATVGGVGFVVQARTAAGGTSTTVVGAVDGLTIPSGTWGRVSVTHTVGTADTTAVRFAPWVRAGQNTYWIDDMLVVDVTEAQAAITAATAAQQAATEAQTNAGTALSKADNALTMAGSRSRVLYSGSAPSGTGTNAGDMWRQIDADKNVKAEWYWDGSAWQSSKITSLVLSGVDVGKLTAGAAELSDVVAQKIASGTAAFQKADVGNLTAGEAAMDQAVIDKLWSDVVRSRKIETDMLAANSVTSDQIAGNAIDGMIVTGATVRTAAAGQRVEMNTDGLSAYNTDGLPTFSTNGLNTFMNGRLRAVSSTLTKDPTGRYVRPAITVDPGNVNAVSAAAITIGNALDAERDEGGSYSSISGDGMSNLKLYGGRNEGLSLHRGRYGQVYVEPNDVHMRIDEIQNNTTTDYADAPRSFAEVHVSRDPQRADLPGYPGEDVGGNYLVEMKGARSYTTDGTDTGRLSIYASGVRNNGRTTKAELGVDAAGEYGTGQTVLFCSSPSPGAYKNSTWLNLNSDGSYVFSSTHYPDNSDDVKYWSDVRSTEGGLQLQQKIDNGPTATLLLLDGKVTANGVPIGANSVVAPLSPAGWGVTGDIISEWITATKRKITVVLVVRAVSPRGAFPSSGYTTVGTVVPDGYRYSAGGGPYIEIRISGAGLNVPGVVYFNHVTGAISVRPNSDITNWGAGATFSFMWTYTI